VLSDKNKIMNVIDEVLSEKGPELDKEGGKESIRGVIDALMQNNRFTDVILLDGIDLRNPAPGVFPSPLSWEEIQKICNANHVDALFSLELFETNSKINYSAVPTTVKTPFGDIPALEHHADMLTTVVSGWRIYDPQLRIILDEFTIPQTLTFSGSGVNPLAAAGALLNRKEAVRKTGYRAGQQYAGRLLSFRHRVYRDYYIKGSENFKIATRMARAGDWNEAALMWKKEIDNPNRNIQGRAFYNMAIISEINGDLDMAINWAKKAYEMDNNKLALRYIKILKYRKSQDYRLEQQRTD
jgi:tetratricopeptide (TPR) repeat protein